MFRIDDPTAVASLPTPEAAGTPGYFTEGNPGIGEPATLVRGSWLNMLQEEIIAVLLAAGISPSKTTYNQLLTAIQVILAAQTNDYLVDTGAANAYVCAFSPPISSYADGLTVKFRAVNANTGASTLNAGGGAAALVREDGAALQAGDVPAGGLVMATYDTPSGHFFLTGVVASQMLVNIQAQLGNYVADTSGTANTITVAPTPALTSYFAGLTLRIKVANANTGGVTINVNSLGGKTLTDSNGSALPAGALAANKVYTVTYDGTNFELQSIPANLAYKGADYATDTGTANTYVASISPAPASLTAGLTVKVKIANANTGGSTLNLNGFGAVAIVTPNGSALIAGDLPAGAIMTATYDGTHWQATDVEPADAAFVDVVNTFTKNQGFPETALTDGATISWAAGTQQSAAVSLGGNRTLANATGHVAGFEYTIRVTSNGHTLAYGSQYIFDFTPDVSQYAVVLMGFYSDGTNLRFLGYKGYAS